MNVKVRTNEVTNGVVDVFGTYMRPISDNISTRLYDSQSAPYGATTIENYVYKVQRINQVDQVITPTTYKGPTFFKLFKL